MKNPKRFNMNGAGDLVPQPNGGWLQFNEHRQIAKEIESRLATAELERGQMDVLLNRVRKIVDRRHERPGFVDTFEDLESVLFEWSILKAAARREKGGA